MSDVRTQGRESQVQGRIWMEERPHYRAYLNLVAWEFPERVQPQERK